MHWRRQMLGTCPGATWYPVLEGECDMRVPQVSERIKEAPAQALRGVFAGIGQLLLITDKLRNKASHQDVPRARTPGASETVTDTTVTSPAGRDAEPAATAAAATAAAPAAEAEAAATAAAPAEAVADGEAVTAGAAPAKPAPTGARRSTARPTADKPVTAKPPAKPAAAKPASAKPVTPRRTAAKAAAAEAAGEAAPKPPKRQSSRNFDKTGNVRLLGDEADSPAVSAAAPEPAAAEPLAAAEPVVAPAEPVVAPAEPVVAPAEPVVAPAEPAAVAAEPAAAAPLPNYDELSVASLRARLRNLDVAQVRQLAEYERAHAARADVLTMFERRIAKLEAEA